MAYQIMFSADAERQLRQLTARDRTIVLKTNRIASITHEPSVYHRSMKKP